MDYLLLALGLILAVLAAWKMAAKENKSFDVAFRAEVQRPINPDLVALYELKENVEAALSELDEKNQIFGHLVTRLEKQRETVEYRLKQMENLITRTEAALNQPVTKEAVNPRRVNHDQVYRLYDQVKDITGVASELGIGKGEVELILGLRKE